MRLDRRAALGLIGGGGGVILSGRTGYGATALMAQPPLVAGRLTQGGWARGRVWPDCQVTLDGAEVPTAASGDFLIAFDRDAPVTARLDCRKGGQVLSSADLTIAPRAWQIEQVDAPLRPPGVPDAEFQRRRADELARIAAARALPTGAEGWRQTMVRPAPGRISGRFGAQRIYRGQPGAYHSGLDLAAAAGTPILAPADGVVVLAAEAPFTLEGLLLMVDHGMGLTSAFLHCSAHLVTAGAPVRQGQPVARVGMTGRATGPHLHWGLRWRTARLDPLLFLADG
ncbi:M23 family metallopeptidase [Novosphingobium sp.]|uniref:M23 family metallopeptidase n=1 Tax=Novosphingobium sp. TaxID=1874826 RepID=UPI00260DB6E0|nr:M23 family metallopeptidase [Novosphingobium sp.]